MKQLQKKAEKDFKKITEILNQAVLKQQNHTDQLLYADYHIGQIQCLHKTYNIELIDIPGHILIQIHDTGNQMVLHVPSSCRRHVPAVYINTLIELLSAWKEDDSLKDQLNLRPFGTGYEYKKGLVLSQS